MKEVERIKETIMGRLARELGDAGFQDRKPVILRAEVRIEGLRALPWLCAQEPASRGYWSNRDDHFELAGVGGADVITGDSDLDYHRLMETLHQRLGAARGTARYFGGMHFAPKDSKPKDPKDGVWGPFKAYRFILPRFEVVSKNGTTIFACNMLSNESLEAVKKAFSQVVFPETDPDPRLSSPVARLDYPDERGWRTNVEAALAAFKPGEYEKVVLARRATFDFQTPVDAATLLYCLKAKTTQSFHFLFQPHARTGFVGASPERLYRRDGDIVRTEAIAGSRPRSASPEQDKGLSDDLMNCEKDLREHEYVVKGIQQSLSPLCGLLAGDKAPSVLKLTHCQHLITSFKGRLRKGVKDSELLENLHPTPAVGGYPRAQALRDIARLEPFDRGWYAGPVGWISKDDAQFVVGIRSGLTEGSRLHLFSGAGIVAGSVPEKEWEEIENKISDFVTLFGSCPG